jgi:hypothetical protein
MEELERAEPRTPAPVSQVARDAHEDAARGHVRLRTARNPRKAPPEDLAAARDRMEQSILDGRKAHTHCPICGALGNWKTDSVKKPLRYLICGGCGVGRVQIAVMPDEVDAALGPTAQRTTAAPGVEPRKPQTRNDG